MVRKGICSASALVKRKMLITWVLVRFPCFPSISIEQLLQILHSEIGDKFSVDRHLKQVVINGSSAAGLIICFGVNASKDSLRSSL